VNSPCNGIARACAIEPRNAKNTNDVIDANFTRVTSFEANHRSLLTYTSGSSFIEGGRFSSPSAAGSASSAIEIRSLEERPVWLEEYAPMITLRFGFVPVPIGAALFLLAGCGGMQPQVGDGAKGQAVQAGGSYNRTFNFTGKRQSFTVPFNVKWLTVVALGAAGASSRGPAHGGRVFAVIPVSVGERLIVVVGGVGSHRGGFNGGGDGGTGGSSLRAYGGGGASDVREGGDSLADRVLVAGGGGGAGARFNKNQSGGRGGKGGGSVGGSGADGWGLFSYAGGGGGGGGTQQYGGSGGVGGSGDLGAGNPGKPGSVGTGGMGGAGCTGGPSCWSGENGGGGGGGYYGGGGGGAGGGDSSYSFGGGGGGGGSSYIEPSAKKFQSWQGWHQAGGNGLVVFSWR
jgi:hypothetical protein